VSACKANRGNLLQHWSACEVLEELRRALPTDALLRFVDGYAMAPASDFTRERATNNQTGAEFRSVRTRLPGLESVYEQVWAAIVAAGGVATYPSTAVFASHLWKGSISFLLCENDRAAAESCIEWVRTLRRLDRAARSQVAVQNWRKRFLDSVPLDGVADGISPAALFLSFDPDMYDRHSQDVKDPRKMYASDIERINSALARCITVPTVVQLSTYSANGDNSQSAVVTQIGGLMALHGWKEPVVVRADGNMMSMIFVRGVDMVLGALPERFSAWRRGVPQDGT
jgi:hypothetical protein